VQQLSARMTVPRTLATALRASVAAPMGNDIILLAFSPSEGSRLVRTGERSAQEAAQVEERWSAEGYGRFWSTVFLSR
jgi:hypothetical protein